MDAGAMLIEPSLGIDHWSAALGAGDGRSIVVDREARPVLEERHQTTHSDLKHDAMCRANGNGIFAIMAEAAFRALELEL